MWPFRKLETIADLTFFKMRIYFEKSGITESTLGIVTQVPISLYIAISNFTFTVPIIMLIKRQNRSRNTNV